MRIKDYCGGGKFFQTEEEAQAFARENNKTSIVDKDNIHVEGYEGTWYVIDEASYKGETLYLLEHNEYGDEAPNLVIDGKQHVYLDDVYNGWLDMEEAYDDFINPESY